MANLTISGLQKAQQDNTARIARLKTGGVVGRVVQYATVEAHRYAVSITHVITGSLRSSQLMQVNGTRGMIYINPAAINPRTKEKPAVYGAIEEARGGSHAFYARTLAEAGDRITRAAGIAFVQEMNL